MGPNKNEKEAIFGKEICQFGKGNNKSKTTYRMGKIFANDMVNRGLIPKIANSSFNLIIQVKYRQKT